MLCWLDINKTKNRNVFVYTNINNMYADVERSMSKNYYYIKNVSVGPINEFFFGAVYICCYYGTS